MTAWALLAVFVPLGGWLAGEIARTIGLSKPHLWDRLRTDRVFDLAMLDLALTAMGALLVIGDRSRWRGWRFWVVLPVFRVIPTLGIVLHLLLDRRAVDPRPHDGDHKATLPGDPDPGATTTPGSRAP